MADPPENACNATKAGALHAKRAIRTAFGHHLECITNRWLRSCLPFFLSGAEKACVDCGLWHGGECSGFPSDYSERLFRTVLDRQDESNLIALDMKTITARLASTHKGGLYHFSFRRSKEQKCCTAFIVHNPLAPHLVTVIPRSYLEVRPLETAAGDRAYYGRDIPMTGAVQEYFPLEWAPFVMAIRSLPGALRSLHDFASGLSRFWCNPFNDISFATLGSPVKVKVSALLPSGPADWEETLLLWQALDKYSVHFKAERPVLQPSVADLLIVDCTTGSVTTLELKGGAFVSWENGRLRPAVGKARPFLRQWNLFDWILILDEENEDSAGTGVILSSDDLPDLWFHQFSNPELDQPWLEPNQHQKIAWSNKQELAVEIDRVLLHAQSRNKFRATRDKQVRSLYVPSNVPTIHKSVRSIQVKVLPQCSQDTKLWRGSGQRWSRKQFESFHQSLLERQLCKAGRGRLLYLGKHPCGSLVFAPFIVPELSFHDLHLRTPLVYINMSTIDVNDNYNPFDGARTRPLFASTHGNHESIYLIAPRLKGFEWTRTMKMYVVPSWELCTPERKAWHEELFSSTKTPGTRLVRLASGKHIESYGCAYSMVMQRVADLSRAHADRLYTSKTHAVQQFMLLYTGESFLGLDGLRHGAEEDEEEEDDDEDRISNNSDEGLSSFE